MQGLDDKRHNCYYDNTHSFPLRVHKIAPPHIANLQTSILRIPPQQKLNCQLQLCILPHIIWDTSYRPSTCSTLACLCANRNFWCDTSCPPQSISRYDLFRWDTDTNTNTNRRTLKAPNWECWFMSSLSAFAFALASASHPKSRFN